MAGDKKTETEQEMPMPAGGEPEGSWDPYEQMIHDDLVRAEVAEEPGNALTGDDGSIPENPPKYVRDLLSKIETLVNDVEKLKEYYGTNSQTTVDKDELATSSESPMPLGEQERREI